MLYCSPKSAAKSFVARALSVPQACGYEDWWWKARLGKAYYQLGLLRDAEQQLASSLRNQVGWWEPVGAVPLACQSCSHTEHGCAAASVCHCR